MDIVSQVIARTLDCEPPFLNAEKCLNRRQTKHPCTLCHDRCPAGALPVNPVTQKTDWSQCIGCGICVDACPQEVLEVPGGVAEVVNEDACIGCGECLEECPMGAITEIAED